MITTTTTRANAWIRCPDPKPDARLRLFCFPYAGGGASVFYSWSKALPAEVEVCPVQLPGREHRLREAAFEQMTTLVQVLVPILHPYLDRPFAIFGHSMGAMIGHALAQQLQTQLGIAPGHFFVAGRRAPHCPDDHPPIHRLPDAAFLETVRQRYEGIPAVIWQDAEWMAMMLPLLRADFTLIETSSPQREPLLDCPITALGGVEDPHTNRDNLNAWREATCGAFTLHMLPGGHFFVNEERGQLLKILSRTLLATLQATSKPEPGL